MHQPRRSPPPAHDRRRWLIQTAAPGGWRNRAAAGFLLLDGLAGAGVAAALALGLTALPHGLAAAAPWLALLLSAALLRGGCAWAGAAAGAAGSAAVRAELRRRTVAACLAAAPATHRPVGETMTLAIDAVEALDGYVARFLPAQRAAAAVPLLIMAATGIASPVCAAILTATLLPFIGLMILAGGAAADESRRQFAALSRLSGLFADRVRALPMILSFQAEQREAARLGHAAEDLRRRTMGVLRVAFISSAGLEFFAALSVALVAVYCGFSLLHLLPFRAPEHLTLARALFALAAAPEFYAPMRRLAAAYHDRQAAETAADRLIALSSSLQPVPPRASPLLRAPAIRFEAVSVRYPGAERDSLHELEFTAAPGQITVLRGPSGCGKTTVLNLLLGRAPLIGGEVWIDDQPLTSAGSLAGRAAWMGQASVLVPGTIAENLCLSRLGGDAPHRAEIVHAAAQAGLAPLLHNRPGGLDAPLDERGSSLSGGERRRIALARAFLSPAPILLLDEPTAHLDAASERALIDTIRQVARGRTTLIATHSDALAAIADTVVDLAS